jgi:hypothetical protein
VDISKWNYIMKSFQDMLGYDKGTTEVLITKRFSKIGFKDIESLDERESKYLIYILRKKYREILDNDKKRNSYERVKAKH